MEISLGNNGLFLHPRLYLSRAVLLCMGCHRRTKWAIMKYRLRPAPDIFSSWLESAWSTSPRSAVIKCLLPKSKPHTDLSCSPQPRWKTRVEKGRKNESANKALSCFLSSEAQVYYSEICLDQRCFRNEGMQKVKLISSCSGEICCWLGSNINTHSGCGEARHRDLSDNQEHAGVADRTFLEILPC